MAEPNLRTLARAAACIAALVVLANCTAPTGATQSARNAPVDNVPEVSRARAGDVACLAEAIYFEARGTGTTGETAVAHVVVNRARSAQFPNSVCGVVADACQFSYRCDGRPDVLADPGARGRAYRIAETVLAGAPDFTGGALFFHAASVSPSWFSTRPQVGKFGGNVFYR
jgi:spore germination cell wall hydrolase CwlJ-like protein